MTARPLSEIRCVTAVTVARCQRCSQDSGEGRARLSPHRYPSPSSQVQLAHIQPARGLASLSFGQPPSAGQFFDLYLHMKQTLDRSFGGSAKCRSERPNQRRADGREIRLNVATFGQTIPGRPFLGRSARPTWMRHVRSKNHSTFGPDAPSTNTHLAPS